MENSEGKSVLKVLATAAAILGALAVVASVAIFFTKKMKKSVKQFNEEMTTDLEEENGSSTEGEEDCQVCYAEAEAE